VSTYKITAINMFLVAHGQLKGLARALTIFLAAIGLQACSNDLSKSGAKEILEKQSLGYVEARISKEYDHWLATNRGVEMGIGGLKWGEGGWNGNIDTEFNGIMLDRMQKDGWIDVKTKQGIAMDPMPVKVISPLKKLSEYIRDDNAGSFSVLVLKLEFDDITRIAMINDSTALVEFSAKWSLSPFASYMSKDIDAFSGNKVSLSRHFRRYDDGWRLVDE